VTELPDLYAAGLERHLALGRELTEADGDVVTPACPRWTVRDVYAHLAGGASDVLTGRLDGVPGDGWTERHVGERRGRSLADLVAEYAEVGPKLVEALGAIDFPPMAIDQWAHEQDVRGALGRAGSRDVPVLTWGVARALEGRADGWSAPPVRIRTATADTVLGAGEPAATFEADDFELLRAVLGRRSVAQWKAMATTGSDPVAVDAAIAGIPFFNPRGDDLVE
jgi:uncharacterized protein (TIGR03083 family)